MRVTSLFRGSMNLNFPEHDECSYQQIIIQIQPFWSSFMYCSIICQFMNEISRQHFLSTHCIRSFQLVSDKSARCNLYTWILWRTLGADSATNTRTLEIHELGASGVSPLYQLPHSEVWPPVIQIHRTAKNTLDSTCHMPCHPSYKLIQAVFNLFSW